MQTKPFVPRRFWSVARRTSLRALVGGAAAAAVGAAFCALIGAVLCLAHGIPWLFAGLCALRGGFAGLVAGGIVGAMSGASHTEAPPAAAAEKVENCSPELANCNPAPPRATRLSLRNGKVHSRLG